MTATTTATPQGAGEKKRIAIPDNPAGRLAFDVFRSIAKKMIAVGNEATNDFALSNFPEGKTVRKDYDNRKFLRIIEWDDGQRIIIIYDYTTQTTASALFAKSPINDEYLAGASNINIDSLDLYY